MYAITGVTGQVGGAVADTLLSSGRAVRAVVRDVGKGAVWRTRGCDLALADMTDARALKLAFEGVDGVFVLIPPTFDPSPDLAEVRAVVAALRSSLESTRPARVVMLSTVGAQASQPNLLGQLGLAERELGALSLPIAFVRAAWFMDNAAWDVQSARTGVIKSYLQPSDREIPMIATTDVGMHAARLLQQDWTGRRIVELQGPAPVSPQALAAAFAALLGHKVQAQAIARESWEALFRSQGMVNPLSRMQMLDGFNQGWIKFEGGDVAEQATGATTLAMVLSKLLSRG